MGRHENTCRASGIRGPAREFPDDREPGRVADPAAFDLPVRTLAGANTAGLLLGGSFFGLFFVGTLYMQQVLHYSALQTGVAWLATSWRRSRSPACRRCW